MNRPEPDADGAPKSTVHGKAPGANIAQARLRQRAQAFFVAARPQEETADARGFARMIHPSSNKYASECV